MTVVLADNDVYGKRRSFPLRRKPAQPLQDRGSLHAGGCSHVLGCQGSARPAEKALSVSGIDVYTVKRRNRSAGPQGGVHCGG